MANFNNIPERGKGFKYVNSPPLVTAPTDEQQAELDALDAELAEARAAQAALGAETAAAQAEWEASLEAAGPVDWNLRDGLLAYHAFDGTIDGIQTSTDVPAVLEDGLPRFYPGVLGHCRELRRAALRQRRQPSRTSATTTRSASPRGCTRRPRTG